MSIIPYYAWEIFINETEKKRVRITDMYQWECIKPGDYIYLKYKNQQWESDIYEYKTKDAINYVLRASYLNSGTLYSRLDYTIQKVPQHMLDALGIK